MIKNILIILLFTLSIFSSTLDQKIDLLYKAPKEQRYKIMNEIKLELIKLNQSQREFFINKLLSRKNIENSNTNHNKNRFKLNYEMQHTTESKHLNKHHLENKKKENSKNNNGKPKHNKPKNGKSKHNK